LQWILYILECLEWDSSVTVKSSELTLEASNKSVINKGNSSGSLNIVRAKTGFSSGKGQIYILMFVVFVTVPLA